MRKGRKRVNPSGNMIIRNTGIIYKNKQDERFRFIGRKRTPQLLENISEQELGSNRV